MQLQIKKRTLYFAGLILAILVAGFFITGANRSGAPSRPFVDPVERIYMSDPARKLIGTRIEDFAFSDLVSGKTVRLSELVDKVVILESFSVGCPACAEGIKKYNQIYDKYAPQLQIAYLNINPADSTIDIFTIKKEYQGRDWIWVKHSPELQAFLANYKMTENDVTYILKNNEIVYADSLSTPLERIEKAIQEALTL